MNGLWTVEFGSSAGIAGAGVAVFRDGKIMGGDSGYYYIGEYRLDSNHIVGSLNVIPFAPNIQSVFGTTGRTLKLKLDGSLASPTSATLQGYPEDMPNMKFGAKLTKRC